MLPENLKELYLDHIALAVDDLEQAVAMYEKLGLNFSKDREIVESEKVKVAFAPVDTHARIELLEAMDESSSIASFIRNKGSGIHHLCFRVDDVEKKSQELRAQGLRLIYEEPRRGANNCLINFIHPKSCGGVLIEISQKLEDKR